MLTVYTDSIVNAIIIFPFVALLFTTPYMIYCYRHYGSLIFIRILIVYSFILYLMCAYFLVILPLPDRESVALLTTPRARLIPFASIGDIFNEAKLYGYTLLHNPAFYQILFNILLTVPFGMYLRYYFKLSFKKTILYTFFLSLFFELTQLSGLYFIYARSYRLFELDDLFYNTSGGAIGYLVMSPISKILPTRESIDEKSFDISNKITWIRKTFMIFIDIIVIGIIQSMIISILAIFNIEDFSFTLLTIIYIFLSTYLLKGRTIGMIATKIRIVNYDGQYRYLDIIKRTLSLMFIYYLIPYLVLGFVSLLTDNGIIDVRIKYIFDGLTIFYYLIIYVYSFIKLVQKKDLLFEKVSKTRLTSYFKK